MERERENRDFTLSLLYALDVSMFERGCGLLERESKVDRVTESIPNSGCKTVAVLKGKEIQVLGSE